MATLSGGDELQKRLAEIAANLGDGKTLRVGFLEGAIYDESGTSVPMVAAANEFGDPAMNRPPRPFFRNMIADKSPEWPQDIAKIAEYAGYDADTILGRMGGHIKDQLVLSINEFSEPALSPVTVAKKGFDKPLIDTSHMRNSVDYDIKDGV